MRFLLLCLVTFVMATPSERSKFLVRRFIAQHTNGSVINHFINALPVGYYNTAMAQNKRLLGDLQALREAAPDDAKSRIDHIIENAQYYRYNDRLSIEPNPRESLDRVLGLLAASLDEGSRSYQFCGTMQKRSARGY